MLEKSRFNRSTAVGERVDPVSTGRRTCIMLPRVVLFTIYTMARTTSEEPMGVRLRPQSGIMHKAKEESTCLSSYLVKV